MSDHEKANREEAVRRKRVTHAVLTARYDQLKTLTLAAGRAWTAERKRNGWNSEPIPLIDLRAFLEWNEPEMPTATVVVLGDPKGCGFWLPAHGEGLGDAIRKSPLDEWFECAIPDDEHDGRDHILTLRKREELTHA